MSVLRRRKHTDEAGLAARQELQRLRSELDSAYSAFNSTADDALLEACILEISALRSRYGRALQNIKSMDGEKKT